MAGQFDANQNDKYLSLASLCDQICIDLDLSSSHYFNRFLSWACIGLMDLNLETAHDVRTELLPISDVNTVQCPPTMIDWCKIGIQSNQYVRVLCENSALAITPRTEENWNPTYLPQPGSLPNGTGIGQYSLYGSFLNCGGVSLPAINTSLPQQGQFKVVKRGDGNKEILLDASVCGDDCSQLYLEYIGIGISPCGDTILEASYYEYVRAYVHHQYELFGKRADKSESAIERTGRHMWHQLMVTKGRKNVLTPTDISQINRRAYRLTNKI